MDIDIENVVYRSSKNILKADIVTDTIKLSNIFHYHHGYMLVKIEEYLKDSSVTVFNTKNLDPSSFYDKKNKEKFFYLINEDQFNHLSLSFDVTLDLPEKIQTILDHFNKERSELIADIQKNFRGKETREEMTYQLNCMCQKFSLDIKKTSETWGIYLIQKAVGKSIDEYRKIVKIKDHELSRSLKIQQYIASVSKLENQASMALKYSLKKNHDLNYIRKEFSKICHDFNIEQNEKIDPILY